MSRRPRSFSIALAALMLALCVFILAVWAFTTTYSVGESIGLPSNYRIYAAPHGIGVDWISPTPIPASQHGHFEYDGPVYRAETVVNISYPLAALATAAFPATLLLLHFRRRALEKSRMRSGLCIRCGYNMAFTPDHCPECGEAPVKDHVRRALSAA